MADLETQIATSAGKQKLPVKSVVVAVQVEWHDSVTTEDKAKMDAIVASALGKTNKGDA